MKITLSHGDIEITHEIKKEVVSLTEFMEAWEDILKVSGYSHESIKDWIVEWGKEIENKRG